MTLPVYRAIFLAGSGTDGYVDGTGAGASFSQPLGLDVSLDGSTLYVADLGNNAVRKVDTDTGAVTTFALRTSPTVIRVGKVTGNVYVCWGPDYTGGGDGAALRNVEKFSPSGVSLGVIITQRGLWSFDVNPDESDVSYGHSIGSLDNGLATTLVSGINWYNDIYQSFRGNIQSTPAGVAVSPAHGLGFITSSPFGINTGQMDLLDWSTPGDWGNEAITYNLDQSVGNCTIIEDHFFRAGASDVRTGRPGSDLAWDISGASHGVAGTSESLQILDRPPGGFWDFAGNHVGEIYTATSNQGFSIGVFGATSVAGVNNVYKLVATGWVLGGEATAGYGWVNPHRSA